MRTSETHPLHIDSFPLASGRVGMTLCPGRKGPSAYGESWNRDLKTDVDVLKAWGVRIVISLTEEAEMERLGVSSMPSALHEAEICWLHVPIPDTRAPDRAWLNDWRSLSPRINRELDYGGRVVIHCKAGLERTALVAALLQCERGVGLDTALAIINEARPNARPLPSQLQWLRTTLGNGNRR